MKNNLDSVDLMKLILSLMVIAIHVPPLFGGGYNYVLILCRMAVPLFFITSSYLLYRRLNIAGKNNKRNEIFKKYIIRNLKLYFSWFILLSPWIILRNGYLHLKLGEAIMQLTHDIFIGSTFRASWYLSAQIIGSIALYLLGMKINNNLLLSISLITYIPCVLGCAYGNTYTMFSAGLCNGPLVAMVWLTIGKCIADNEVQIKVRYSTISKIRKLLIIISAIMIYIFEYLYVSYKGNSLNTDALFSMLLVCPILFILIIQVDLHLKYSKQIRAISVVSFCFHGTIQSIYKHGFESIFGFQANSTLNCLFLYISTLISCVVMAMFLINAGKHYRLIRNFY